MYIEHISVDAIASRMTHAQDTPHNKVPLKEQEVTYNNCLLKLALDHGMSPNVDWGNGLFSSLYSLCILDSNVQAVRVLIEYGLDVNAGDGIYIRIAAQEGRENVLQALILAGGDVNLGKAPNLAIIRAAGCGSARSVQIILQAGAKVSRRVLDYIGTDEKEKFTLLHNFLNKQ